MKWENVYIFISSTFNDMHAERDYLIKRVFPELRLWCSEHKLKLIDIDLRWGVSEKDATENKRVVEVCLNNVDKCRPFLLCLLGQRRGWIPGFSDINQQTLENFPKLSQFVGKHSITELEIIHGLLHPLNDGQASMRHAFFYYRKPDYISAIKSDPIRQLFQREIDIQTKEDEFEQFKKDIRDHYDVVEYEATWNSQKTSLELKNVHGQDLSAGRLEHFHIEEIPFSSYVISQLKEAIQNEFPEHFQEIKESTDLEKELNHQDTFLFSACDSYISRPIEEKKILDYFHGDSDRPCILMAEAGTGKTSILAHLIQQNQIPEPVFYRFIGTSSASSDLDLTLYQLMEELSHKGLLPAEELDKAKSNLMLEFPTLLKKIKGNCYIILDAVDQWNHLTTSAFRWLPEKLPSNVKLLLSMKTDGAPTLLTYLKTKNFEFQYLEKLSEDNEKIAIIMGYLSSFLKDIDDTQILHILQLMGSDNPLYLKIVLNELRIHGSFDTLMEQLKKNYGSTPKEAFHMVLKRLEQEEFDETIPSKDLVKYVLGTIGCSTEGVLLEEYAQICKQLIPECRDMQKEDIMDAVYGLVRHLSSYLVIDGNRVNFLYDSFRQAVNERYQDTYTQFHNILTTLYSKYCYESGGAQYNVSKTSYLTNYIFHATECSKVWAESILTDPCFLYSLLCRTSARKVSSYFAKIVEKYENTQDYSDIANLMARQSMRLDVGPNTLFDTLKRYIGLKNALVYQLCDKASKVMDLEYFTPVKEDLASGLEPDRELNLYTGGNDPIYKPEPFLMDEYMIYVEGTTILIQNIYTEEIEKQITLSRPPYRAYAFRGYLYVHYSHQGAVELGDIETFRLPTMESVFFSDTRPELPEKFDWYTICYGCNGIQYQYAMDRKETRPELIVYNMNTGEVQIHSTFPEDTPIKRNYSAHEVKWCNEYVMEECKLYDKSRIWHAPTGKLLLESDCDWMHFMACEQDDMWYVVITRERQLTAYHFRKINETEIALVNQYSYSHKQLIQVTQIGVCNGQLYLFFTSGDFWIFDATFQFVGHQKLPFKIDTFMAGSFSGNQFLYFNNGYLIFMIQKQLLYFDMQACNAALQDTLENSQTTSSYEVKQFGQRLTLLESHGCQSINLRTLRTEYSQCFPGYNFEKAHSIKVGYNDYIIDVREKDNLFEVQMINARDLSVGLRFHGEKPEEVKFCQFAFYHEGIVGVLFSNKDYPTKLMNERKNYSSVSTILDTQEDKLKSIDCVTYTIAYYDTKDNFKQIDVWHPDVCTQFFSQNLFISNKIPYLVFLDHYVDEEHFELQIYHAITKELVFSYRYNHTQIQMCSLNRCFSIEDLLYVKFHEYESEKYIFLEIDPGTKTINEHYLESRDAYGYYGSELYLYDSFYHTVIIYDLLKKEKLGEIPMRLKRYCYGVYRKGDRLIILISGGICEVYDANSYEYLYSQMLMPNFSNIHDCKDTDLLYTSKNSSDYIIFKADHIRNLML